MIALFVSLLFCLGCKRQDMILQIDSNAPAPVAVTNVETFSTPGGADITYSIPADTNLLYVEAVYQINSTVTRQTKASLYKDTLKLSGFGDTLSHEIQLFSVGRNGKKSDPITVEVKPLTPPFISVYRSLTLESTFGGAAVTFKNLSQDPMALVLMYDSTGRGTWGEAVTYYTQAPEGFFANRGLDSVETKFALYVRDRWNNRSDTIFKTLTPLYEEVLDKSLFKEVHLPTDNYAGHTWSGLTPRNEPLLWNNIWNDHNDVFHTIPANPEMPQWFTFDLGAKYALSRFKLFSREGSSGAYIGGDPEIFEIWGSNDPDISGGWDSWTLLGQFTAHKPSGPGGTVTAEDVQYAVVSGADYTFAPGAPAVRYLRFKTLKTWGGFGYVYISELTFWGQKN